MSIERHYFPGNNTPLGFYSYYKYILGQRKAHKIICIKGGPGTGKSTFMKKIGAAMAERGEDIDYLHCSADENSLDGIVLKKRKIAFIDGTSPHMTDPVTPGAVDRIMNLGEYWNEAGIATNKQEIIDLNEACSGWYRVAYNYLNAAKSVFRSLEEIYNRAAEYNEIYRVVADISAREYGNYDISIQPGKVSNFFASAITSNGVVDYLASLLEDMEKIYIINVPTGYSNNSFMTILREGAIYRGFDTEAYYCSLGPDEKIDHLLIPQLKLAFVTVNEYHDIEPWEICDEDGRVQEITLLDISDYMDCVEIAQNGELLECLQDELNALLNRAVECLKKAKELHLQVESMYVPNMNFTGINRLLEETILELTQEANSHK